MRIVKLFLFSFIILYFDMSSSRCVLICSNIIVYNMDHNEPKMFWWKSFSSMIFARHHQRHVFDRKASYLIGNVDAMLDNQLK